MKPSRRSFGAILAGGVAAAIASAGEAQGVPSPAPYPALARLAQLLPDRAGCQRLASGGLAQHFDRSLLEGLDAEIGQALAAGKRPADILHDHNAEDFRAGRTLKVGGFLLARTEAAAALLRAKPNHA